MRSLAIEGFQFSTGVLNVGDADYQLAKSLDMKVIKESPFSHVSDEAHGKNLGEIRQSDVVILARVPIGVGNLKNILAAQKALEARVKVIIPDSFDGMDYTDGKATEIFNNLKNGGAITAKDESEILDIVMSI
jgi:iron complex transport system ATP-binding protein